MLLPLVSSEPTRPTLPYRTSFPNGWSFELRQHEGKSYLSIPVTGWGGYGGAASREQERWVTEQLEPLDGVRPQWMGQWAVDDGAVPQVIERLERERDAGAPRIS